MKKGIIVLLLALVVVSGVFAQEEKSAGAKSNWISGELSLTGAGARYERMLNENWSLGANAYWNNLFLFWNELEVGLSARYYPWGKTFFAGIGLGFHIHSGTFDFKYTYDGTEYTGTWFGDISGVAISPEVGWKIDVGNVGGFFVQPGIKVPITFGSLAAYNAFMDNEFRVGVGFVVYCGLGFAF